MTLYLFFFGFQGAPQLRYSADYEVIKEQNIAEKISFLNENLPQSSCVKVRDAPWWLNKFLLQKAKLTLKSCIPYQRIKDQGWVVKILLLPGLRH